MKNSKGIGLVYLLVTVLILALLAVLMLKQFKPSQNSVSEPSTSDPVQQAQNVVDAANERIEQYKE